MTESPSPTPSDSPVGGAPGVDDVSRITNIDDASPANDRVAALIGKTIDVPVLASAVQEQRPADAADILEGLDEEEAADVLSEMDDHKAAEALAHMETPLSLGVIADLIGDGETAYAARMLALMASDDAADVLQALPEDHREHVLGAMPLQKAVGLRRLIGYAEDTAGGLMTTDFIALRADSTVGAATEVIRSRQIPAGINHLVVVSRENVVVGVITLRALLIHDDLKRIEDLMISTVRVLRPEMDQEQVAREFDRYDAAMMPVVDEANRILGIVTFDDIIDTIRDEQTEDVQMTVGAGKGEAVYSSLGAKLRGRSPWLATSLVLTLCASGIILANEAQVRETPILAMLLPVNAALVGNAGNQALAVTLRGIILDQVRPERTMALIVREGLAGLLMGIVLGIGIAAVVLGLGNFEPSASLRAATAAGIAMVFAMGVGTLTGSAIPLLMRRFGFDPAQSSAIFLIMVTDFVSFSTLLLFSRLLL
ncbi:MAG: magnesium transporter [Phycisphaerales bacterium]|nr:magnesium transporter [Phycisphaerales bacterium]